MMVSAPGIRNCSLVSGEVSLKGMYSAAWFFIFDPNTNGKYEKDDAKYEIVKTLVFKVELGVLN